jgi:5-methylcytosine-specific restriction endonuclease McrA
MTPQARYNRSPKGKLAVVRAKARYRESQHGKAHEQAYKQEHRARENELARVRAKLPDNLAKQALRQKRRRAALIPRAHPSHREKIDEVYAMATSLGMTVDHIVPLYGENVWGLHAPQNLQILTRAENSRKRDQLLGPGPH